MNLKKDKFAVGVIIGRFQVPELHESHQELIEYVVSNHSKVIILLGVTPTMGTKDNPLDFEMRKQMILSKFPNINVLLICDSISNEVWSKNVDNIVSTIAPMQKIALYGSRDSFISSYSGRFPTFELEADKIVSGTQIRLDTGVKAINSPDFRSGVIWAYQNQYPKVYTTVDIAIIKNSNLDPTKNNIEILLGRKPDEKLFRFIGGFVEPDSDNFEIDAMREVMEETGLSVHPPKYIGSFKIDDWRYRKGVDRVKTVFYACEYMFSGNAKANDDIQEVKWFDISFLKEEHIMPVHRILFHALRKYLSLS